MLGVKNLKFYLSYVIIGKIAIINMKPRNTSPDDRPKRLMFLFSDVIKSNKSINQQISGNAIIPINPMNGSETKPKLQNIAILITAFINAKNIIVGIGISFLSLLGFGTFEITF